MIVTLIPRPDFAPVPRIEIVVSEALEYSGGDSVAPGAEDLDGGGPGGAGALIVDGGSAATLFVDVPEGTNKVTIWRTTEGRELKVRGAVERAFLSGFGVQDVEAAPNAVSAYEMECWDGTTPLGRVSLGATTLPWEGADDEVLLQQPLDPHLHAVVKNMSGSWPSITRQTPGELVDTQDTGYPTYVGFGPQSGVRGIPVDFEVASIEDARRVWATRGTDKQRQLPIWLIRSPHPGILPPVFFAHVPVLEHVDVTVSLRHSTVPPWSRFQAVISEVKPPAAALVAPSLTYSDLKAVFETYTELKAALPTYSEIATAWQYAGAAG